MQQWLKYQLRIKLLKRWFENKTMGQIPVVIAVWISETKKGRNANKLQCKTIYCLDCDNSLMLQNLSVLFVNPAIATEVIQE